MKRSEILQLLSTQSKQIMFGKEEKGKTTPKTEEILRELLDSKSEFLHFFCSMIRFYYMREPVEGILESSFFRIIKTKINARKVDWKL